MYSISVAHQIKYLSMCTIGGTLYCGIRLMNDKEEYFLEKYFGVQMQGAIWTELQEVPDG